MRLTTYDEFLTELCDNFDSLIAPAKIRRTNRNVVYLLLKAFSKGLELVNSVCYALSGRFDPRYCADDDLDSSAALVGTVRRPGSGSGLRVVVTNTDEYTPVVLYAGTYIYAYNADVNFTFEVPSDITLEGNGYVMLIAMSDRIGSFPVTAQSSIAVTSEQSIAPALNFSCEDNTYLQGRAEESLQDFRERLRRSTDRQSGIIELEDELKALPYLFDARCVYNNTGNETLVGNVAVPYSYMAVFAEGDMRADIARIVSEHIICPTVSTADSTALRYENDLFISGYQEVHVIPFEHIYYKLHIDYAAEELYINPAQTQSKITHALRLEFNVPVHRDIVSENDIYEFLSGLGIPGVRFLAVQLSSGGTAYPYIEVPKSIIAQISADADGVTYTRKEPA